MRQRGQGLRIWSQLSIFYVLLDATKGNDVHQKNTQTHFKKWIADQTEMNFSETDQDEIIL